MDDLGGDVTSCAGGSRGTMLDEGVSAGVEALLELPILTQLRITGAVSLHTGKSPGFKLQLALVAISADSTSCLLGF